MQIELDPSHEELVQRAVAEGRATDAQTYLQSLIDQDMAGQWVRENQAEVEGLLRERLRQPGVERERGDFDSLRQEVESIVEDREQRRAV